MSEPLPRRIPGAAKRIPSPSLDEQAARTGLSLDEIRDQIRAGIARRLSAVTSLPRRPGA